MDIYRVDHALFETTRRPASGVASNHAFLLALELATAKAQEGAHRVCVVTLDVRASTASASPPEVDRLMAQAARLLLLASGRAHALTRIGRTAFAMLVPDTDIVRAHVAAFDLHCALALYFNAKQPRVAICAGVACSPAGIDWSGGDLLDLALWRCDQAREAGHVVQSHGLPVVPGGLPGWPSAGSL